MFKVILIPIDVTQMEAAAMSLAAARELVDRHDTKTILLSVLHEIPAYVAAQIPRSVHEQALSNANASLTKLVEEHNLPSGTEVLVREGHPSNTILEVAHDTHADVIVIASHNPVLADYLLGSVASRVVRHAHCSVLVARSTTS